MAAARSGRRLASADLRRGNRQGWLLQRCCVGRWRRAELRERGKKGEAMGIEREWLQVCVRGWRRKGTRRRGSGESEALLWRREGRR